jgi:hypothetical protein
MVGTIEGSLSLRRFGMGATGELARAPRDPRAALTRVSHAVNVSLAQITELDLPTSSGLLAHWRRLARREAFPKQRKEERRGRRRRLLGRRRWEPASSPIGRDREQLRSTQSETWARL